MLEDDTLSSTSDLLQEKHGVPNKRQKTTAHPVDLELEVVLGKMPQKVMIINGCSII